MRECYLCQQLWLLSSKDSPLMTPPISFIYSHLFSCIALPLLFHFVPLPSPPSQCFAPSRFFLISFSLWVATKGWRSGSDVWMSSPNLPMKGEKKVTEQGAGGWGKHTEVITASWRVFPFLPSSFWNLKEFEFISSHRLPSVFSLQHIQLYLQSEIERNGSSGSEVMKEDSFRNTQWDIRRREERIQQGCLQILLKSCVFKAFPQHLLCHVHFLIWSMWRQQFPGKEHVSSPCYLCLLCMSSLATKKKNSGVLLHVRTHWCPHCGGVGFDLKANWSLTFVFQ